VLPFDHRDRSPIERQHVPMSKPIPNIAPSERPTAIPAVAGEPFSTHVDAERASLVEFACVLLRGRRLLVALSLAMAALVAGLTLLQPRKYTTSLSFTPVASDAPGGALSSLAGQFGVSLPSNDASQSPDFYARLLQTPDILLALAQSPYVVPNGADTLRGTFVTLYDIDGGDRGKTLAAALQLLSTQILSVGYDRQTSIVDVKVRTKWPALSQQMASRLLELVNDFNLGSRQQRAADELRFFGERLDTARAELRDAENRLQSFLDRNRSYQGDPALVFEHDRRQRDVTLRQDVYSMLTQAVEQARIRAVRNTPSISLVERPAVPLRADRRNTVVKLLGGMFAGFVLAVVCLMLRELFDRGRADAPADFETLGRLWRDTRNDARRLVFLRRRTNDSVQVARH